MSMYYENTEMMEEDESVSKISLGLAARTQNQIAPLFAGGKQTAVIIKRGWMYHKTNGRYRPRWAVLKQADSNAVLNLFQDRSHVETGIAPVCLISLTPQDKIEACLSQKTGWRLLIQRLRGVADLHVMSICRNATEIRLASSSQQETEEWLRILRRVKDPQWHAVLTVQVPQLGHVLEQQCLGLEVGYKGYVVVSGETISKALMGKSSLYGLKEDLTSQFRKEPWRQHYQDYVQELVFPTNSTKLLSLYDKFSLFNSVVSQEVIRLIEDGGKKQCVGNVLLEIEEDEERLRLEVRSTKGVLDLRCCDMVPEFVAWYSYKGVYVRVSLGGGGGGRGVGVENLNLMEKIAQEWNVNAEQTPVELYRSEGMVMVRNCQALLPLDVCRGAGDHVDEMAVTVVPGHRLRPEWLKISKHGNGSGNENEMICLDSVSVESMYALLGLCEKLRDEQIECVVEKLNGLDVVLWNGQIVSEYFHIHGINLRYLGLVYSNKTLLPHIKEVCLVEMIARSFKYIFAEQMRTLRTKLASVGATVNVDSEERKLVSTLFNLVLASDLNFLIEDLQPHVTFRFPGSGVEMGDLYKMNGVALWESMSFHCGVRWTESASFPLCEEMLTGFQIRTKSPILEPLLYPYLRLNEFGNAGFGLLALCEKGPEPVASDLLYHILSRQDSEPLSPFENYITLQGEETLINHGITLPPTTYMAGLHFALIPTHRRLEYQSVSAVWCFLLGHSALFVEKDTEKAGRFCRLGLHLVGGGVFAPYLETVLLQSILLSQGPSNDIVEGIRSFMERYERQGPHLLRCYQHLAGSVWWSGLDSADKIICMHLAIDLQNGAVEMAARCLGRTHRWTRRASLMLGCYLLELSKIEPLNPGPRQTIQALLGARLGVEDSFEAEVCYALSEACFVAGDYEMAIEYSTESIQRRETLYGCHSSMAVRGHFQLFQLAILKLNIDPLQIELSRLLVEVVTKGALVYVDMAISCSEKMFAFVRHLGETSTLAMDSSSLVGRMGCMLGVSSSLDGVLRELARVICMLKIYGSDSSSRECLRRLDRTRHETRHSDQSVYSRLYVYGPSNFFARILAGAVDADIVAERDMMAILAVVGGE